MNYIQAWLYLIGTKERAQKLRRLLDKMIEWELVECEAVMEKEYCADHNIRQPGMCPTQVLFGAKESAKLYTNPNTRQAQDAWDNGTVTIEDLRRFCLWIEQGRYKGEVFQPKPKRHKHAPKEAHTEATAEAA